MGRMRAIAPAGMNLFLRDAKYGDPTSAADVYELLGLSRTQHLPHAGLPPRVVQGIEVWVDPVKPSTRKKSSTHRVKAKCPVCQHVLSAGRLRQHSAIHCEPEEVRPWQIYTRGLR